VVWPTLLSIVGGAAWLLRPVVEGRSAQDSLGSYSVLARSYHPLEVAKWFVYHVGDLGLYVAVIPVVVAPVMVVLWWRRARTGSARDAAFLALFLTQNVVGIGFVAAFASTPFGLGLLYDRYLFYLVPLWLIVLVAWREEAMPRPRPELAVGGVLAVVTIASLPFGVVAKESWFSQFEAVATEVWGKVGAVAARLPIVSARDLGILFAVTLVAAAALVPRRHSGILLGVVVAVFAANLLLSWRSAFVDPAAYGSSGRGTRSWVDARVGRDAHVTMLLVDRGCNRAAERASTVLTDFFNRSVDAAVTIGGETRNTSTALRVHPNGELVFRSGRPFEVRYVVTQPGIELRGRRVATGMATHLVLWSLADGPVRLASARSEAQLRASPCTA